MWWPPGTHTGLIMYPVYNPSYSRLTTHDSAPIDVAVVSRHACPVHVSLSIHLSLSCNVPPHFLRQSRTPFCAMAPACRYLPTWVRLRAAKLQESLPMVHASFQSTPRFLVSHQLERRSDLAARCRFAVVLAMRGHVLMANSLIVLYFVPRQNRH